MRQLSNALLTAREGTGEVRAILLQASFRPRLPGEARARQGRAQASAWPPPACLPACLLACLPALAAGVGTCSAAAAARRAKHSLMFPHPPALLPPGRPPQA
jgi:hypothetical protein